MRRRRIRFFLVECAMEILIFLSLKNIRTFWVTLCISIMFATPAIAEDTDGFLLFPLPIFDKLPNEIIYFYPSWDKCCEIGKGIYGEQLVKIPYTIKLPNGSNLTVSDWGSNNKIAGNRFPLIEDTIFIENRDGVKKAIAAGQGWGDAQVTLVLENESKRIYISESRGFSPKWGDLVTREYDLYCSDTECFFYQNRDCLLKIEDVDKPTKILEDLKKATVAVDDFINNVENLSIVFIPTLSGKKENIEFFFDIEKWGKYIHIGPDATKHSVGTTEIYSANINFLLKYGSKCFTDSGIHWDNMFWDGDYLRLENLKK